MLRVACPRNMGMAPQWGKPHGPLTTGSGEDTG